MEPDIEEKIKQNHFMLHKETIWNLKRSLWSIFAVFVLSGQMLRSRSFHFLERCLHWISFHWRVSFVCLPTLGQTKSALSGIKELNQQLLLSVWLTMAGPKQNKTLTLSLRTQVLLEEVKVNTLSELRTLVIRFYGCTNLAPGFCLQIELFALVHLLPPKENTTKLAFSYRCTGW